MPGYRRSLFTTKMPAVPMSRQRNGPKQKKIPINGITLPLDARGRLFMIATMMQYPASAPSKKPTTYRRHPRRSSKRNRHTVISAHEKGRVSNPTLPILPDAGRPVSVDPPRADDRPDRHRAGGRGRLLSLPGSG